MQAQTSSLDAISRDQVELALLQIFFKRLGFASASTFISAILFGIPLWLYLFKSFYTLLCILFLVVLGIAGLHLRFVLKKIPITLANAARWQKTFFIYSLLFGLGWGTWVAWLALNCQGIEISIVVAVLLCVCSVIINLTMAQRDAMLVFLLCLLLTPCAVLILQGGPAQYMTGALIFTAFMLMVLMGLNAHQGLRSQLETGFQLRNAVSEASLAREQAEKASSFKSQFLANMSHEIRTPMNAVLGMLKLLQSTKLSERQLDYAIKGEGAANTLLGLLNEILDFSKIEAGKIILDLQPLSIHELLQDLMMILQAHAAHKSLHIHFDIDPRAPQHVIGDAMRLRQVLINLAFNAIKFTEQGHILLRLQLLSQQGAYARIRFAVEDTGIGIAPNNQASIFEEFTQAENTITRRFGGTGLGLSISQQLVKAMGGRIHVQSELGVGSTFSFELPMQIFTPQPPSQLDDALDIPTNLSTKSHSPKTSAQPRLTGMHLLVVEDNLLNQQIARELLTLEGALVEVADHGAQGLEILTSAQTPFDALLLDLQMPTMDGFAMTRVVREQLGMHNLPIIAMTANAMESDRQACLDAGMHAHISKPFNVDILVTVIQAHVLTPSRGA